MEGFFRWVAVRLLHAGGPGLLILGVLDSSFLVLPFGNDLLVVALSARRHALMPYYAAISAAGSVIGCLIVDIISRKAEQTLESHISGKKLQFLEGHIRKHAGWVLAMASLMPPPFPFTPVVAAVSAFGYSRKKLLAIIAGTRMLRFGIDGSLAIIFGRKIIGIAESPAVKYAIYAIIAISIAGSAYSIYRWVKGGGRVAQT